MSAATGRSARARNDPEPPSGSQHQLVLGDQEVVVTEVGATLRSYTVGGRPAILGFAREEQSTFGRGQMLIPWPGRVGGGRYGWEGVDHQLPLDEVKLRNAIHGLVRWANWVAEPISEARVVMRHRLHPRDGYPFCLDLAVSFELESQGLSVALSATNLSAGRAPFGAGAHPYLTVGTPLIDSCCFRIPAATVLVADDRLLPVAPLAVDGTEFDYRMPRTIGNSQLDTAFTDLARDPDGLARVSLESPEGGRLVLWMDGGYPWLLVFTGDALPPDDRRRGLAVEPMTCPPDAFRTGRDLISLEPGGSMTARWGIDTTWMQR